jgi:hypothetical protein
MKSGWELVEPAPKQERGKSILKAPELVDLLADAVIDLALAGKAITVDSVKTTCPTLARLYPKKFSTIPTYLGAGRRSDGLQLYRVGRTGPHSPSRENAILACRHKEQHGHDMEAFARERGFPSYEALQDAVDALRPHEAFDGLGCPAAGTAGSPSPPQTPDPAAAAPGGEPEGTPAASAAPEPPRGRRGQRGEGGRR